MKGNLVPLTDLYWKFRPGDVVRHKTGTCYIVRGYAYVEANVTPAYVYQEWSGHHGALTWVRPKIEFEDGRFSLEAPKEL